MLLVDYNLDDQLFSMMRDLATFKRRQIYLKNHHQFNKAFTSSWNLMWHMRLANDSRDHNRCRQACATNSHFLFSYACYAFGRY
jgi:hypothetical protein